MNDAGPYRAARSAAVLALVIVLVMPVGAALVVWTTAQPRILETINCPVHEPGQTPWPGLPAPCRW